MCRWLENEVLLLSMSPSEVKNLNEQILTFFYPFLKSPHQRKPEGSPETELTLLLTSGLHLTPPFGLMSWRGYEDKTNEIEAVRLILITYRLGMLLELCCMICSRKSL